MMVAKVMASLSGAAIALLAVQILRGYAYYKGYRAGLRSGETDAHDKAYWAGYDAGWELHQARPDLFPQRPPAEQAAHPVWGAHSRPRSV